MMGLPTHAASRKGGDVHSEAERVWSEYHRRAQPGPAYVVGQQFHWQWEVLREWLHHLAVGLEEAGAPPEKRERILRGALSAGMPSQADAQELVEMLERLNSTNVPDSWL